MREADIPAKRIYLEHLGSSRWREILVAMLSLAGAYPTAALYLGR